jgi:hypothetical protein
MENSTLAAPCARCNACACREAPSCGLVAVAPTSGRTAIAAELNCTETALRGCASKFGIAWRPRRGTATRDVTVPMSSVTRRALIEAARCRGLTTSELAARIIRTVAGQGLVDAVLDDGCDGTLAPTSPLSPSSPPSSSPPGNPECAATAEAAAFTRRLAAGDGLLEALKAAAQLEEDR